MLDAIVPPAIMDLEDILEDFSDEEDVVEALDVEVDPGAEVEESRSSKEPAKVRNSSVSTAAESDGAPASSVVVRSEKAEAESLRQARKLAQRIDGSTRAHRGRQRGAKLNASALGSVEDGHERGRGRSIHAKPGVRVRVDGNGF